jgi:hypothetical protein
MASKKQVIGGIGAVELLVIGVAAWAIYKAMNKDRAAPSGSSDKVTSGGYTMKIPKGVTAAQKQTYQAAFDAYVEKYETAPSGQYLDSPATAAGQERALINYVRDEQVKKELADVPYIEGFNYEAVFGFGYPGASPTPAQVKQAEALGVSPELVAQAAAEAAAFEAFY